MFFAILTLTLIPSTFWPENHALCGLSQGQVWTFLNRFWVIVQTNKQTNKQQNHTETHADNRLKVGFHYPSSRPEFTGRVDGPRTRVHFFDTRQLGPSTRVVETWRPCTRAVYTSVRFPLPELTARVDGCQKMHQSSRAVNSARELG